MYCTSCGQYNDDDMRFCTACGKPLDTDVTVPLRTPTDLRNSDIAHEKRGVPGAVIAGIILALLSISTVLVFVFLRPLDLLFPKDNSERTEQQPVQTSTNRIVDDEEELAYVDEREQDDIDNVPTVDADDASADEVQSPIEVQNPISVAVKSSLAEYSWAELKELAGKIESCTKSSEALSIAQEYNLVDANGNYPFTTKEVITSDGKTIRMRLVGIWHDDTANAPSGKAGLTFMSSNTVAKGTMSGAETISGGWGASSIRSWLSTDFWSTLPNEVADCIIPTIKHTNNTGESRSINDVTDTSDKLWVPSIVELCGPINWEYQSNPANSDLYNSILNSEGHQYPAYAQEGIDDYSSNKVFSLGEEWWLRSSSPSSGKGRFVSVDGDPSHYGKANESRGIVLGFCL